MEIFFNSFFENPAGKGASFLNIKATKKEYDERYARIVKKISIKSVTVKKTNIIYLLVKIPSTAEGIFYDVVFEFGNTRNSTGDSISDRSMKIFSNSPSFVYTYLFAYNKKGVFIKNLRNKLPKEAFEKSDTKNPYNILSYDFSVYASMKYILDNGYTSIASIKLVNIGNDFSIVQKVVRHFDKVQKERTVVKNAEREQRKEEKLKHKKEIKNIGKNIPKENTEQKPAVTNAKTAKVVKKAKLAAKAKTVKKAKRI